MSGTGSKATQFRKGQSGNPKGRPKKATAVERQGTAFDIIVDRTLTLTRNGRPEEVSVEVALQHKTYRDAVAGDRAARREVLKMIEKREAALARQPATRQRRSIPHRIANTPDNANDAMRLLGIVVDDPRDFGGDTRYDRIRLLTWAVNAALRRRRGGRKLERGEIEDIKRQSLEADEIRWPSGTDA